MGFPVFEQTIPPAAKQRLSHHQRHVKRWPNKLVQPRETFGRNADHTEVNPVDDDDAVENRGIRTKSVLPKVVAENDHRVSAGHATFFWLETASKRELDAKHAEQVLAHHRAHPHFASCLPRASKTEKHQLIGDQSIERSGLLPQ